MDGDWAGAGLKTGSTGTVFFTVDEAGRFTDELAVGWERGAFLPDTGLPEGTCFFSCDGEPAFSSFLTNLPKNDSAKTNLTFY